MGKLLKFPKLDAEVLRNCGVCGKDLPVPADMSESNDIICFTCFLWEQVAMGQGDIISFLKKMEEEE